jgi:hypothetical protein
LGPFVKNYNVAVRNLVLPTLLCVTTIFLLLIGSRWRKFRLIISSTILLLLVFELFRFGWKITPFSEKAFFFPKTPVIEFLESRKMPVRISAGDTIPNNMWMPFELETADGYDAVYPLRIAELVSNANSINVDVPAQGRVGGITNFNSRYLDLTNTKYILGRKIDQAGNISPEGKLRDGYFHSDRYNKAFEDKSVVVSENSKALERAFVVTDWEVIASEKEVRRKLLLDESFPLSRKIIFEEDTQEIKKSTGNESQVNYLEHSPQKSTIQVKTKNPGFLFISDTFFPGWKSKVDGREVVIKRANYAFRAIPLKQGEQKVEMFYDPLSFKLGIIISTTTLLILSFIFMLNLFNIRLFNKRKSK